MTTTTTTIDDDSFVWTPQMPNPLSTLLPSPAALFEQGKRLATSRQDDDDEEEEEMNGAAAADTNEVNAHAMENAALLLQQFLLVQSSKRITSQQLDPPLPPSTATAPPSPIIPPVEIWSVRDIAFFARTHVELIEGQPLPPCKTSNGTKPTAYLQTTGCIIYQMQCRLPLSMRSIIQPLAVYVRQSERKKLNDLLALDTAEGTEAAQLYYSQLTEDLKNRCCILCELAKQEAASHAGYIAGLCRQQVLLPQWIGIATTSEQIAGLSETITVHPEWIIHGSSNGNQHTTSTTTSNEPTLCPLPFLYPTLWHIQALECIVDDEATTLTGKSQFRVKVEDLTQPINYNILSTPPLTSYTSDQVCNEIRELIWDSLPNTITSNRSTYQQEEAEKQQHKNRNTMDLLTDSDEIQKDNEESDDDEWEDVTVPTGADVTPVVTTTTTTHYHHHESWLTLYNEPLTSLYVQSLIQSQPDFINVWSHPCFPLNLQKCLIRAELTHHIPTLLFLWRIMALLEFRNWCRSLNKPKNRIEVITLAIQLYLFSDSMDALYRGVPIDLDRFYNHDINVSRRCIATDQEWLRNYCQCRWSDIVQEQCLPIDFLERVETCQKSENPILQTLLFTLTQMKNPFRHIHFQAVASLMIYVGQGRIDQFIHSSQSTLSWSELFSCHCRDLLLLQGCSWHWWLKPLLVSSQTGTLSDYLNVISLLKGNSFICNCRGEPLLPDQRRIVFWVLGIFCLHYLFRMPFPYGLTAEDLIDMALCASSPSSCFPSTSIHYQWLRTYCQKPPPPSSYWPLSASQWGYRIVKSMTVSINTMTLGERCRRWVQLHQQQHQGDEDIASTLWKTPIYRYAPILFRLAPNTIEQQYKPLYQFNLPAPIVQYCLACGSVTIHTRVLEIQSLKPPNQIITDGYRARKQRPRTIDGVVVVVSSPKNNNNDGGDTTTSDIDRSIQNRIPAANSSNFTWIDNAMRKLIMQTRTISLTQQSVFIRPLTNNTQSQQSRIQLCLLPTEKKDNNEDDEEDEDEDEDDEEEEEDEDEEKKGKKKKTGEKTNQEEEEDKKRKRVPRDKSAAEMSLTLRDDATSIPSSKDCRHWSLCRTPLFARAHDLIIPVKREDNNGTGSSSGGGGGGGGKGTTKQDEDVGGLVMRLDLQGLIGVFGPQMVTLCSACHGAVHYSQTSCLPDYHFICIRCTRSLIDKSILHTPV